MAKLTTIISIFISALTFAQTNFDKGFSDGYKKGYCQDQGNCIEPIPPIAPIPGVYENSSNYQDGYNRGFQQGLNAQKSNNNSSNRTRYQTSKPEFVDDFVYNPYKDPNYANLQIKVAELKFNRIKELYQNGLNSYNNDDYASAISYANEIINIDASFPKPYALKAMSQFYKGEILNSYNNISKAKELNYTDEYNIKLINEKVRLYIAEKMKDENYTEVKYFCENVWYKNDFSYYFLGLANYYLNDIKEAKKALKKVDNFKPAEDYLIAIKENKTIPNPFTTNKQNSNTTQNQENKQAKEYYDKIANYYETKEYIKVIELLKPFENAIEIGKTNDQKLVAYVYSNKTYCNYYMKNWKDCISDATKAINSKENINPELYFIRAMAKSEIKDYYGANTDYDYLIDNYTTLNYKGNSLATLINNKAYNYVLLNDFKSATPLINRALSLDKNTDYIWGTKGELEYKLGNYTECVKAMDNALKIKETDNSYYYRGLANVKLGNKANGCKDLSKAGELGFSEAYNDINKYCK